MSNLILPLTLKKRPKIVNFKSDFLTYTKGGKVYKKIKDSSQLFQSMMFYSFFSWGLGNITKICFPETIFS